MSTDNCHQLLVLDKAVGMTSRAAVDRAARWFPRGARIGHTGTLDPLASGVLVLCVGQATRLAEYVQCLPKTYLAEVTLGAHSATDDAEGPISVREGGTQPDLAEVTAALAKFIGEIRQTPPGYSAAKVHGRRAYALARRGEHAQLSARTVRIDAIDVLAFAYPKLSLKIDCGKGTYIRALARDLGETLGCGAYLSGLRRTAVGPFVPEVAIPLDADAETAAKKLLPLTAAIAHLPRITASGEDAWKIAHGQTLRSNSTIVADEIAIFNQSDRLVAIAAVQGDVLKPIRVFSA